MIVVIEGIDGSGKTTQAKMAVNQLKKDGYETIYVQPVFVLWNFFNSKDDIRTLISPRRIHLCGNSRRKSSVLRMLLTGLLGYFYANISHTFMKLRYRYSIVVCDRYFYQFFFDLFGEFGEKVLRIFPKPNIVFFLDGDPDTLYLRMKSSDKKLGMEYYKKVLSFYRIISGEYDFITLDALSDKYEIHRRILNRLRVKLTGE